MKKTLLILLIAVFTVTGLSAAESVTGLWRGVDENTGKSTMFTYIYESGGKLYGRMVVTFDEGVLKDMVNKPGSRAEKLVGDPFYAGLDIIWGLEDKGTRWKKGKICDPKEGKIYDSEIWREGDNLIVRGKIGPFGRNQTWRAVGPADLPPGLNYGDPAAWKPSIPVLK